ncbi:hypothetical protein DFA_01786 [Cavenderia fasciculata]|uniref:Uncharacterized protein n=1 Tax=Cavenderia fasciculata TaxID=261658 RepID=F4PUN6_CACFS|nr:uncharacterized protein DFA_01786 [Cavenderia fasciculata]EGG21900.1 hypothetical protein DFA_01786 [Cavenderia fasciculata]|eukprot:XP_004359751.1 hypothetical protein DFA_01786 [Cavenderia fasciculata]
MIGDIPCTTDKGTWTGPNMVDKIFIPNVEGKEIASTSLEVETDSTTYTPTYKGTYTYLNRDIYEGFCLNGKRHGHGKMTFPTSSDQVISIEGNWKEDEVSYPTTITYSDVRIDYEDMSGYIAPLHTKVSLLIGQLKKLHAVNLKSFNQILK